MRPGFRGGSLAVCVTPVRRYAVVNPDPALARGALARVVAAAPEALEAAVADGRDALGAAVRLARLVAAVGGLVVRLGLHLDGADADVRAVERDDGALAGADAALVGGRGGFGLGGLGGGTSLGLAGAIVAVLGGRSLAAPENGLNTRA